MIVVTAAGGRTATAVVPALRERGGQVRAGAARRVPRPEPAGLPGRRLDRDVRAEDVVPRGYAEHLAGLPVPDGAAR